MKLRALALVLALAACGQAPQAPRAPAAPDPFDLHIEIGRYGYMLHQVGELTDRRPGVGEPETTDPRDQARRLREIVWRYNLARSSLCARGLFAELACGPVYAPIWLSDPASATPTLEELQIRAGAVGDEVTPFWQAVCADARSRAVNEDERQTICPME